VIARRLDANECSIAGILTPFNRHIQVQTARAEVAAGRHTLFHILGVEDGDLHDAAVLGEEEAEDEVIRGVRSLWN
jgi:hypothetical protein